jgi:hypothetical protein
VGTQFIVTHHLPRLLVFALATVTHEVLLTGMSMLLGLRAFDARLVDVTLKALVNALAGVGLFSVVDFLPGARERWRARSEVRRRARFR